VFCFLDYQECEICKEVIPRLLGAFCLWELDVVIVQPHSARELSKGGNLSNYINQVLHLPKLNLPWKTL